MTKASCVVDFSDKLTLETDKDAQPVVDAINKCRPLKYLFLSGNPLGWGAAEAIGKALEHHPELKVADFSKMGFKMHAVCHGLMASGARLQTLDLNNNWLGPDGMEPVLELLKSETCSQLQELRVNYNQLGSSGSKHLADALLSSQCRLKEFQASFNNIGDDGAQKLAVVLGNMGTLEEINLAENIICDIGIRALSQALKRNPQLNLLNLSGIGLRSDGAVAIAEALPSLKNLKSIDLGDCSLKSEGGDVLAKAFRNNAHSLEYLDLRDNWIGDEACKDIVNSIKASKKLRSVILWGNGLTKPYIKWIYEKLGSRGYPVWCIPVIPSDEASSKDKKSSNEDVKQLPNHAVEDVDKDSSGHPVVDEIKKHSDPQRISLSGYTLNIAAAKAIAKVLERHPELKEAQFSNIFSGTKQSKKRLMLSVLCDGMMAAGARLRSLDLSANGLGLAEVEPLATLLKSEVCSQLQELLIDYNHLCSASGRLLAEALTSSPCRLRVFAARLNELGDVGANELAPVFGNMGTLEEVDLRGNSISKSGVAALSEAFKRNPRLCRLNLSLNDIGPDGAAAIADALHRLPNVKSLDLGNSRINEGGKALAKAFKENSLSLEFLDLNNNKIGDEACMDVFGSITAAHKLKRLVLAGNGCVSASMDKIRKQLGARAVLHYWKQESKDEEEIGKKLSSVTI